MDSSVKIESELSYLDIKNEVEKQIKLLGENVEHIKISYEKGEFQLKFRVDNLDDASFLKVILLAKRHIENWRIHTFEEGYLSLQTLNKNLFSSEGILSNFKIRLSRIYGEKSLELTKKKAIDHSELSLMTELIKYFLSKKKSANPMESLKGAGCRIYEPKDENLSFQDIGGYEQVKEEAREAILLPLQNSDLIYQIAKITRQSSDSSSSKAILFDGPPGVGKTTMAKIVAKEAGLPLIYVPIESIMSAYYGESSKRLALIFDLAFHLADQGKKIILFLDEIDALAPSRNEKLFEATRRLLSVLLRKIDGIESRLNCLTIGATNRKDDLDQALLSRFETIIEFPYPKKEDIINILAIYAKHLSSQEKELLTEKLLNQAPRFIQSVCKKSERIHAGMLIKSGTTHVTPPPLQVYFEAVTLSKT